jgi:hypothetical protein
MENTFFNKELKYNLYSYGESIKKVANDFSKHSNVVQVSNNMIIIYSYLKEAIEVIDNRKNDTIVIPEPIIFQLNIIVKTYIKKAEDFLALMQNFNTEVHHPTLRDIIGDINTFYHKFFSYDHDSFLPIYNTLKFIDLKYINSDSFKELINGETGKLNSETERFGKLVDGKMKVFELELAAKSKASDLLLEKLKNNVVSDYAKVFQEQADKYSSFNLFKGFKFGGFKSDKWKIGIFKFGEAQKWLLGSFVSIVVLIGGLILLNRNYSFENTYFLTSMEGEKIIRQPVKILLYENIAVRILFVSLMIYVLAICLKNYSISKHLYVINKHRQNSLESYKLFADGILTGDTSLKQSLMLEVAKSIFGVGSTGYLNSKDSVPAPSIIELTRIMNKPE